MDHHSTSDNSENKARTLLQELSHYQPEMCAPLEQIITNYGNRNDYTPVIQLLELLIGLRDQNPQHHPGDGMGIPSSQYSSKAEPAPNEKGKGFSCFFKTSSSSQKPEQRPPAPKKPRVKYSTIVTGETHRAEEQILEKMRGFLELIPTDEARCDVVFLFCVVISRVGSDVECAMDKIPERLQKKPLVLVVMHHQRKPDFQTSGVEWSSKYDKVKSHVEVLYHDSTRGLVSCNKNEDAIMKLVQACVTYAE